MVNILIHELQMRPQVSFVPRVLRAVLVGVVSKRWVVVLHHPLLQLVVVFAHERAILASVVASFVPIRHVLLPVGLILRLMRAILATIVMRIWIKLGIIMAFKILL